VVYLKPVSFGAFLSLGHAPLNLWFLSLAAIFLSILEIAKQRDRSKIALFTFFLGMGYFILTLNWIVEPFFVDFISHAWIAPFAIFFISIVMSLFWYIFSLIFAPLGARWALLMGVATAEYFRSFFLTGFPWGTIASLFVSSPLGQLLAIFGPFGFGVFIFTIAIYLIYLIEAKNFSATLIVMLFLSSLFFWGWQRQNQLVQFTDKTILLVQPNAPQIEKWDEKLAPVFFDRMIKATLEANKVDLIVWPESAIYQPLNFADELLGAIDKASAGVPVAFGALRFDENENLRNSLILQKGDDKQLIYDKSILVPFGEYLPVSSVLSNLGLRALVNSYGSSFTQGHGADLIEVEPDLRFQPLICYEAIFPSILRATSSRPDFILQITNDAWFGRFSGPYQHLQILKMRAIETGLPVARSANTGISAVISANGTIVDSLPLETEGSLELGLPKAFQPTIYYNWGESIFYIMILSLLLVHIINKRYY
tara:strand:+ start:118 stop:1563 length:1446 start_codon:yes stop_codon:yes gene_type:complete